MNLMTRPSPVRYLIFVFGLLLLSGCGYHFGMGEISSRYSTVAIPFIEGDMDGDLTAALVRQISCSGALKYVREGGDLILLVRVIDYDNVNIGFRYDRKKRGSLKHELVPTETRLWAAVDVTMLDAASNCTLLGPTRITASFDFDHDYYSSRNSINVFSLGQLSDIDEAQDAAKRPLHEKLAQKIVDYIINAW